MRSAALRRSARAPQRSPLVRQELAVEDDPHARALLRLAPLNREIEADRAHDPVAEVLVDQRLDGLPVDLEYFVEAVDRRVRWRQRRERAAHRYLLEERHRLV